MRIRMAKCQYKGTLKLLQGVESYKKGVHMIKKNKFADNKVFNFADVVKIEEGKSTKNLFFISDKVTAGYLIFDKDTIIAGHKAESKALVQDLLGDVLITIEDKEYTLHEGEAIVIKENMMHELKGITKAKVFVTILND